MKNSKKILLGLLIIALLLTACKTDSENSPIISPEVTDIESPVNSGSVDIFIPSLFSEVDYNSWQEYFVDRFNIELTVYTKNEFDSDNIMSYSLDADEVVYNNNLLLNWGSKGAVRTGLYLINNYSYYTFYQNRMEFIKNHPDLPGIDEQEDFLSKSMWKAFNDYSVCDSLDPYMLNPYTDEEGNVWALPYEYIYPEPMIRKYNADIMKTNGYSIPKNITELYELLLLVNKDTEIGNILPSMKREAVFNGFEDIVNAFGIKTSSDPDIQSFYSIQYNPDTGMYTDIAFSDRMAECIEYFILLIDAGLIELEGNAYAASELFYDNQLFSVYDTISEEDDLTVPYTSILYAYDYEPKLYFQPSRYVYVLGKDQEYSSSVDDVLNAFYHSSETKTSARYGIENVDYRVGEDIISISPDSYAKAPLLIGRFPDDKYHTSNSKLNGFKDRITQENISRGYYEALTPRTGAMESEYDVGFIYNPEVNDWKESYRPSYFANTFYRMLGDYLFDTDRPYVEEFILSYRNEMREQINKDFIGILDMCYYQGHTHIEIDTIY